MEKPLGVAGKAVIQKKKRKSNIAMKKMKIHCRW